MKGQQTVETSQGGRFSCVSVEHLVVIRLWLTNVNMWIWWTTSENDPRLDASFRPTDSPDSADFTSGQGLLLQVQLGPVGVQQRAAGALQEHQRRPLQEPTGIRWSVTAAWTRGAPNSLGRFWFVSQRGYKVFFFSAVRLYLFKLLQV